MKIAYQPEYSLGTGKTQQKPIEPIDEDQGAGKESNQNRKIKKLIGESNPEQVLTDEEVMSPIKLTDKNVWLEMRDQIKKEEIKIISYLNRREGIQVFP